MIKPRQPLVLLALLLLVLLALAPDHRRGVHGLIPLLDGGKAMPKMYGAYFDEQISKQACAAISRAMSAGKKNMEVNFPPVPNVEEAKFGTPLK
jgi:hypothetical protein